MWQWVWVIYKFVKEYEHYIKKTGLKPIFSLTSGHGIIDYKRILDHVQPDKLSIMLNGKIVTEGGPKLVDQLEEKGYGWIEED